MAKNLIAIIGSGSIGTSFAIVFARAGWTVRVYEPDKHRRDDIPEDVARRLETLHSYGLTNEPLTDISRRIHVHADITAAVRDARLVQECVPEQVQLKRELFSSLAELTDSGCIVASSTSFIPSSQSAAYTGIEERVLVAHPGNPPYAIPVIELVPNPKTRPEIFETANEIYTAVGMSPVVVRQEIPGFIFNRLQGALLREAYSLVQDGVASVDDIDTVVRDGLGRRWSFMGPFETLDLNTRGGIKSHAEKMGPSYQRMKRSTEEEAEWTADLVAKVTQQRRYFMPLEEWEKRVAWRDEQLLDIARWRK